VQYKVIKRVWMEFSSEFIFFRKTRIFVYFLAEIHAVGIQPHKHGWGTCCSEVT